jgi:broad specificity phosphatase PhoE
VIHLARHGQTAFNKEQRFQGHLPVPLDETGREQAAHLAEAAADHGFDVLYASPLERAAETARIVGQRLDLVPILDARFAETDAGDWTGRLFADVRKEMPERFDTWVAGDDDFAFPGGESFARQRTRVEDGLAEVKERERDRRVLIVCHRQVMRLALDGGSLAEHPIENGALVPLE